MQDKIGDKRDNTNSLDNTRVVDRSMDNTASTTGKVGTAC